MRFRSSCYQEIFNGFAKMAESVDLIQLPLVVPVLGNFQLKHLVMHLKVSTQSLKIMLLLVTDAVAAIGAIRCQQDFVLIMQYDRAHKKCILYYVLASGGRLLVSSNTLAIAGVLQCSSVLEPRIFSLISVSSSHVEPKTSILRSQSWALTKYVV
jgi:hypothetical protein